LSDDLALVARVVAGDAEAWRQLVRRTSAAVQAVIARYYPAPEVAGEMRNLYLALQADDCAVLRRYGGSPSLAGHVTLEADRLLSLQLVERFRRGERAAWQMFERRFKRDIEGHIARSTRKHAPGLARAHGAEDLYQEFCAFLADKYYQPIIAYRGDDEASFARYLASIIWRWCIDQGRAPEAGGRWRMPQAIEALDERAQRIFTWLDRDRLAQEDVFRRLAAEGVTRAEVDAAIDRVFEVCAPGSAARQRATFQPIARAGGGDAAEAMEVPADDASPEQALLAREQLEIISRAIAALPDEEDRLILTLWLDHDDFAKVAELSGRELKQVRAIKERAMRRLQQASGGTVS
jgi:RNA polymerase sigma factor (sigma-70 family)